MYRVYATEEQLPPASEIAASENLEPLDEQNFFSFDHETEPDFGSSTQIKGFVYITHSDLVTIHIPERGGPANTIERFVEQELGMTLNVPDIPLRAQQKILMVYDGSPIATNHPDYTDERIFEIAQSQEFQGGDGKEETVQEEVIENDYPIKRSEIRWNGEIVSIDHTTWTFSNLPEWDYDATRFVTTLLDIRR